MSELILQLDPPIDHAGGKITELKLREPTGAEMRDAEKKLDSVTTGSVGDFHVEIVSKVSGLSEAAIDELPVSLMNRAVAFVTSFDQRVVVTEEQPAPSFQIDLEEPIVEGGITYAQLALVEPTVGMRRKAETALRGGETVSNARQWQILLVQHVAEIPHAVACKLPVSVLNQATGYLRGFLALGRQIGNQ